MRREQHASEDFPGLEQVMQVGPGIGRAGGTCARLVQGTGVPGVTGVAQIHGAAARERLAGASGAGRQHAVEHVDPARDRTDDVAGLADAHEIPGAIFRQAARGRLDDAEHLRPPLPHRQSADGVTVESDVEEGGDGLAAQVLEHAALRDPEQPVSFPRPEVRPRTRRPAHGTLHGFPRGRLGDRIGRALVQRHGDIAAQQPLDLDGPLRRELARGPVDMGAEGDAVLVQRPQRAERQRLIAARIREYGSVPVHEPMQAAERRDALGAGPQHQVVGIGEDDRGAGRGHIVGLHRLDGARRAHRHERRRRDRAVRRREPARPRRAVASRHLKAQARRHAAPPPPAARVRKQASP